MPEWYGDFGIGFSTEEQYRLFDIPKSIGNIKMRIASEVNFDKNTLQYTDLRLELCENNSFIQDTLIKGDIMESRVSEALCVIEEDKPKMSVLGHFETPKQKLLEVQINRCVNPTALF